MKKNISTLISIILVLGLLVISNTNIVTASETTETDIKTAYEKAKVQIVLMSGLTHPHWKNATAIEPVPYCDLEGRVVCYMFTVEKDGKSLGHIIIGSKLYLNSVFEAGDELPPEDLTLDEAQSIINKDSPGVVIAKPLFNFYSGGFHDFYKIYDAKGEKIAINLYSHSLIAWEDLEFGLLSPEKYAAAKGKKVDTKDLGIKSVAYKNLSIGLYDSYNDCTSPSTGCGPASGAMIASYYENLGYSNFPDWADYPYDDELDAAYEELYDEMDTGFAGTSTTGFEVGFEEYADDCGYSFNAFVISPVDTTYRYFVITGLIDDGVPSGGLTTWLVGGHWYVIRGYYYFTEYGDYYFICNSSGDGTLNGGSENTWIGLYEISWVAVAPVSD